MAKALQLAGYHHQFHLGSDLRLGGRGPWAFVKRTIVTPVVFSRQGYLLGIDTPVELAASAVERQVRRLAPMEFATCHNGYSTRLLQFVVSRGVRPVVIIRDPRGVLASFVPYVRRLAHHPLHSAFTAMSGEDAYWTALKGGLFNGVFLESLKTRCEALHPWLEHCGVLVLRFEDLIGARGGGTEAKQLESLEALLQHCGLATDAAPVIADELWGPGRDTFRRGHSRSWESELPPAVLEACSTVLEPVLQDWGYAVE